jgi:hypothetical protein
VAGWEVIFGGFRGGLAGFWLGSRWAGWRVAGLVLGGRRVSNLEVWLEGS